jgi:hypothetical protein
MKQSLCILIVLSLLAALCACTPAPLPEEETAPATTAAETVSAPPEATATPVATPALTPSATPAATPSPAPSGPEMYSSYAHLVSFDPDTGIAQFDYFDMLKGDEAAEYLVEHEGYTEADAQALVADFADSEFVEKNLNNQLRAIDIDEVSLSLMYQPSGAQVEGAEPVPSTASDFRAIYALDPSLLLDSFFFYIHVESDGHVSLVEQVYWA